MIKLQLTEDEYQNLILMKAVFSYAKESLFDNDEERMIQEAIGYLHTKYSREELINRIRIQGFQDVETGGMK